MKRSLNEIEQTCRKAARGCGIPWGLADETSKAVRWLHVYRIDGISAFISLVEELDHSNLKALTPESISTVWESPNYILSPIVVGASLCDCRHLLKEEGIVIKNVAYPILLAGFLGQVSWEIDQSKYLAWNGVDIILFRNGLKVGGNSDDLKRHRANRVTCSSTIRYDDNNFYYPHIGEVDVNETSWEKLEKYAALTYVKATEASRLSGAGSGLSDND